MKGATLHCSSCGATAHVGCGCGVAYVPAKERAAAAIAADPHKSDRALAREIGVGNKTVSRARPTVSCDTVEKRVGLDGKERRAPTRPATKKPPPKNRIIELFLCARASERTEFLKWLEERTYER